MKQRLTGAIIAVAVATIGYNIWTLVSHGSPERPADFRAEFSDIETPRVAQPLVNLSAKTPTVAQPLKKVPERRVTTYRERKPAKLTAKELDCLARNIYYEAGVENRAGKLAVAQVTLNRRNEGRWGNDLCKVVYAKAQFSWTLEKKKRWTKPSGELWEQSLAVAREFASGTRIRNLEDTQFYHTDYIPQPNWAQNMRVSHKIGQHIFYQKI